MIKTVHVYYIIVIYIIYSKKIHVRYIFYIWAIFGVNVGKYSIHGTSGIYTYIYIYLHIIFFSGNCTVPHESGTFHQHHSFNMPSFWILVI